MTKRTPASAPTTGEAGGGTDAGPADASTPSAAEYSVAFSPRQVAVGLAIVAGLVAIALRHRSSRDRKPADD
jgi:hypothetical protein